MTGEPVAEDLALARRLWDFQSRCDEPQPADAVLGIGSYDDRVADRCTELHAAGLAARVCFSGASGHFTRGRFPQGEARAFADRALALGLPAEALIIEHEATNTAENIRFARALLEPLGVCSLILVAKPNMLMRGWATCAVEWPGLHCQRACPELAFGVDSRNPYGLCGLIHELVGDCERLRVYAERGWSAPVDIPGEVADACRELIARGYSGHLPA